MTCPVCRDHGWFEVRVMWVSVWLDMRVYYPESRPCFACTPSTGSCPANGRG